MARAITKVLIVDEHNNVVTMIDDGIGGYGIETVSGIKKFNRTEYDRNVSGDIIYMGKNTDKDASEASTDWVITKYEYDVNADPERTKTKISSWTDRADGW